MMHFHPQGILHVLFMRKVEVQEDDILIRLAESTVSTLERATKPYAARTSHGDSHILAQKEAASSGHS